MAMKPQPRLKTTEKGMVSMLTVIILSLILTIITTGFLRLIARSQREATDAQLSAQAFYAAETGVEDAKRAVQLQQSNPAQIDMGGNDTDCAPAHTTGGNNDLPAGSNVLSTLGPISYSCQLIDFTPGALVADRRAYQPVSFPLLADDTDGFDTIEVTWSKLASDDQVIMNPWLGSWQGKFLNQSGMEGRMAPLRIQLAAVSNTATLTRDQFYRNERSYFVEPIRSRDSRDPNINLVFCSFVAAATPCSKDSQFNNGTKLGACDVSTNTCKITIHLKQPVGSNETVGSSSPQSLNGNYRSMIRLQPLYHGAHMEVKIYKNNGADEVSFAHSQVSIDVTGRANDVFKRLRVHMPLQQSFDYGNYAAQTAEDICKLWNVSSAAITSDDCVNND